MQRRHAGRAGEPDLDRNGDAAGAQLLEPGDDALAGKRELADDVHAQALRGGAGDLLVAATASRPCRRNARMAFRIGADADLFDAGLAQRGLSGSPTARRRKAPASASTSPPMISSRFDVGFARAALESKSCQVVDSMRARRAGDMRRPARARRLRSGAAAATVSSRVSVGHAPRNRSACRAAGCRRQLRDLGGIRPRGFDREALRETHSCILLTPAGARSRRTRRRTTIPRARAIRRGSPRGSGGRW